MMHELVLFRGTMPAQCLMDRGMHEQYTHGPKMFKMCALRTLSSQELAAWFHTLRDPQLHMNQKFHGQ